MINCDAMIDETNVVSHEELQGRLHFVTAHGEDLFNLLIMG